MGTSLVRNVIDLVNLKSVLDYDYEEKPGADAVRMQYYTGAVSKVELSVMPGKDYDHSYIIMPMLSRSLITNLDILLIGLLPSGEQNSEYGVYGKSINLRLKYSF